MPCSTEMAVVRRLRPSFLHDVVGVGAAAGDPIGEREHGRPQFGKGAFECHARTVSAAFSIASFAWRHDTRRRPGQKKKPGNLRSTLSTAVTSHTKKFRTRRAVPPVRMNSPCRSSG